MSIPTAQYAPGEGPTRVGSGDRGLPITWNVQTLGGRLGGPELSLRTIWGCALLKREDSCVRVSPWMEAMPALIRKMPKESGQCFTSIEGKGVRWVHEGGGQLQCWQQAVNKASSSYPPGMVPVSQGKASWENGALVWTFTPGEEEMAVSESLQWLINQHNEIKQQLNNSNWGGKTMYSSPICWKQRANSSTVTKRDVHRIWPKANGNRIIMKIFLRAYKEGIKWDSLGRVFYRSRAWSHCP